MCDFLLEEIVAEILIRLPLKSLVQCAFVCKSWYFLITNPTFIAFHLNRTPISYNTSINSSRHLLFLRHCPEKYSLLFDNETFDEYLEFEWPFKSFHSDFIGYCNGVLCLSRYIVDSMKHNIVLWNPSIRKSLILPEPSVTSASHGKHSSVFGFGFDSSTNDYKVVRIVYVHSRKFHGPPEVELYTLSTGSWRRISAPGIRFLVCLDWSHTFLNGATHWFAHNPGNGRSLIVSFDMGNEVFGEIVLPRSIASKPLTVSISISVFKGFLSLIQHCQYMGNKCCIWVMEEYGVAESWVKHFTIDLNGVLGKVFGFRKNGEVLMRTKEDYLVSYNLETKQILNTGIHGIPRFFYANNYTESLVLLNKSNGILSMTEPCTELSASGLTHKVEAKHKTAVGATTTSTSSFRSQCVQPGHHYSECSEDGLGWLSRQRSSGDAVLHKRTKRNREETSDLRIEEQMSACAFIENDEEYQILPGLGLFIGNKQNGSDHGSSSSSFHF